MGRPSLLLTLAATLALSTAMPAFAEQSFNRIATFAVAENLPQDIDPASTTSSEIITATEDGNTLIYSDSPLGAAAQKLDIEGLVTDGDGGFWLASEGDSSKLIPHALYHVDGEGVIGEEIGLPTELLANEERYGFEGITTIGEGDDLTLVMAVQREWKDDPKGQVKLLAYKPEGEEWLAARYPLDPTEQGWVGLSEITAHEGALYIIERDNLIGTAARNKRLYKVALESFKPAALDADLPVVEKTLVRDLVGDIRSATNGYVVDKVEGFTIDAAGEAYFVTDNDGVDDSSGETIFVKLGRLDAVN